MVCFNVVQSLARAPQGSGSFLFVFSGLSFQITNVDMNPQDILRYVDSLHREKNIDKELVFIAIESALQTAAKRQYGEEADITVQLDRENGRINAVLAGEPLGEDQIGRIGAQTAKQVIIQKVKEAERDSLMLEYREQIGDIVSGIIGRADGGVATVNLGNVEAILPRSEQIPGETLHAESVSERLFSRSGPRGIEFALF